MKNKYSIQFNKRYLKDLAKIPARFQKQIYDVINALAYDPRPPDCKKLHGSDKESIYRVRCGDYRILYTVYDEILLILVIEIGHRREIYR